MTFDVYVVDGDGDPVRGVKVTVIFSFPRGWLAEYTDDDGHAEFAYENVAPGTAEIFVRDEKSGPHYIEDGSGFTVAI